MWFVDKPDYDEIAEWVEEKYRDYHKKKERKKRLCKRLKEKKEHIYNYFVNRLYLYKSEKILKGNKINILELFMTGHFYKLLVNLDSIYEIEEMFNILCDKQIIVKYHHHSCKCTQHNCKELMIFENVKDNENIIIGNDCINRLYMIFFLMKDEDLSKKTTKIIKKHKIDLDSLIKEIEKQKRKERKQEEQAEIDEWLNLDENKDKTICSYKRCLNKNDYTKRYTKYNQCNECYSIKGYNKTPVKNNIKFKF
jgi:hypothetical protein